MGIVVPCDPADCGDCASTSFDACCEWTEEEKAAKSFHWLLENVSGCECLDGLEADLEYVGGNAWVSMSGFVISCPGFDGAFAPLLTCYPDWGFDFPFAPVPLVGIESCEPFLFDGDLEVPGICGTVH